MTDPDYSRLELRPPEDRLRALRSQRRSGCSVFGWLALWLVVGAGIWAAGIAVVWRVVG